MSSTFYIDFHRTNTGKTFINDLRISDLRVKKYLLSYSLNKEICFNPNVTYAITNAVSKIDQIKT